LVLIKKIKKTKIDTLFCIVCIVRTHIHNKMSSTGYNILRAVSTVSLSPMEARLVKATYADNDQPKEKHVLALLDDTHEYNLVSLFEARFASKEWVTVLKMLVIAHRLSLDGHKAYLEDMAKKRDMLSRCEHTITTTTYAPNPSPSPSTFMRVYARYLSMKFNVFVRVSVSVERGTLSEADAWVAELSLDQLSQCIPIFEDQFEALLACQPFSIHSSHSHRQSINHPAIASAVSLCVRDGLNLCATLCAIMRCVLKRHKRMNDLVQLVSLIHGVKRFRILCTEFKAWVTAFAKRGLVDPDCAQEWCEIHETLSDVLAHKRMALESLEMDEEPSCEEAPPPPHKKKK